MKKCRLFIVLMCIAMFLASCGCSSGGVVVEKETKRKPSTGESWTVMIYMSTSTIEEKYNRAGEVLNSLSYDLPENINVIVEAGGCKDWHIEGMKNDRIQDFVVQKNGIRRIDERMLCNMGEASVYADFLNRTIEKYPADRYISVIWGDGGGPINGTAHDPLYNFDALTPEEVAQALASTETKLDIIGFDASLTANLETAATLVPYADYMVASEDVMPLSGWDYQSFFGFLSENPNSSVPQVGQVICDGVKEKVPQEYKDLVSMSLIDLSDITNLMHDFDTLARGMATDCEDLGKLRSMTARLDDARYMGANSMWEGYSNLVDIKSFSDAVYGAVKSDYALIDRAIDKAVIYRAVSTINTDLGGISIYYPKNRSAAEINEYKKICTSAGYKEFIDKTTPEDTVVDRVADYKQTASYQTYNAVAEQSTITAEPDLNGKYLLYASNPDIIARTGVNLYKYNEEQAIYQYLSTDYDTSYSNIANAYEYKLKNKQLEMNGVAVSSYIINNNGDKKVYSIPVIYEKELCSVRVLMTENEERKEYTVLGIWKGADTGAGFVERKYKMPSTGDTIIPIYEVYGGNKGKYIKGKAMTIVFGGLSIKEKALDDGAYLISYTAKDIYGKETESNTTNVTAIKGKMQVSK